jgi:hypothetical protein
MLPEVLPASPFSVVTHEVGQKGFGCKKYQSQPANTSADFNEMACPLPQKKIDHLEAYAGGNPLLKP